jgi:superfamily II DNA or RNA helicase
VLTPYDYILHQIDMSESEFQEHEDLSFTIAQMTAARENGQSINEDALKALIRKRIRLVGSCENKFEQLKLWVSNLPSSQKHTLFYVGDGSTESSIADGDLLRDIEKVTVILSQNNWRVSKVTADETADERHRIIKRFASGEINAIAAIKVLDEGFDLPACKEAHLLASSRNERQYIQRRGRILRKMRGKELAFIHDYVVIPSRKTAASKKLVQEELLRVTEFSRVAFPIMTSRLIGKRMTRLKKYSNQSFSESRINSENYPTYRQKLQAILRRVPN